MRGEERDGETERRRDKGTEREGEGLVVIGEWRVSTLKPSNPQTLPITVLPVYSPDLQAVHFFQGVGINYHHG